MITVLCDVQVEEIMYRGYCLIVRSFDIFCFDAPAVRRFPFFETVDGTCHFLFGEFRDVSLAHRWDGHKCFPVLLRSDCLWFHRSHLNNGLYRIPRQHFHNVLDTRKVVVQVACICSCLLDLLLSLIHSLIFVLMSVTQALSFLSMFLRLSMRLRALGLYRGSFPAAARSSSYVIASVVAACV